MRDFETRTLPDKPDDIAPDGSAVRLLLSVGGGGMAHFELGPHQVSKAVTHRTVDEIWYFVRGKGQMWRQQNNRSEVVEVKPGMAITIPVGTHFQFRSTSPEPLAAVGVTLPLWKAGEAVLVQGPWLNTMP